MTRVDDMVGKVLLLWKVVRPFVVLISKQSEIQLLVVVVVVVGVLQSKGSSAVVMIDGL